MRILHVLSQRPEMTGSGVYTLAMMRCALAAGHSNALVAGVPAEFVAPEELAAMSQHEGSGIVSDVKNTKGALSSDDVCLCSFSSFVRFGTELPFAVTGMSDVMPYESSRWSQLSEHQLAAYEQCFGGCLASAVQQFQPDIIHSNHLWVVSALAKRQHPHIPVVVSCHGSDLRQFRSVPHIAERVVGGCRSADAVLSLSGIQKQQIIRLYGIEPARIHVAGAGYNRCLFGSEGPWQANIVDGPVCIVYAGKLSRAKGVPWLLRACAALLAEGRDFVLDICGSGAGQEYAECTQLAQALGGKVRLHGNVSQLQLAQLMRAANIFVLPSFFEGLPLVLLEALACGCRLVTTRLDGVDEVFSALPQDVISFVPLPRMQGVDTPVAEEEQVFEQHLRQALSDQLDRVGKSAAESACDKVDALLSRYSWESVFERVEQVYRQLVRHD